MKRSNKPLGIALVETAIILPVIISLLLLFANLMSIILTHQRIISAQIQQQINAQPKPLIVGVSVEGSSLVASISPLSNDGANDYMKQLSGDLMRFLQNSGSFSPSKFGIALSLVYLRVNPANGQLQYVKDVDAAPVTAPLKGPASSGTEDQQYFEQAGDPFYVLESDDSSPCFDPNLQQKNSDELQSFLESKIGTLNPDNYVKVVGTELYEVDKSGAVTKSYVDRKPIVFGIVCARAGILPWQAPIHKPIIIFPNKDVGA